MYVMVYTRLDITYAARIVYRYMEKLEKKNWEAVN